MTNSQRLALVRQCLKIWLADNAAADAITPGETEIRSDSQGDQGLPTESPIVRESILIREGFYCGRRFDAGTHDAVWFIEEDELKISDLTGLLVCVLTGDQMTEMVKEVETQSSQVLSIEEHRRSSEVADDQDNAGDTGEGVRRAA